MLTLNKKWAINYYSEKVFNEIRALSKSLKARYVAITEVMETQGPDLGMPHTKAMGNGLFEIRLKAKEGIARVFYCTKVGSEIMMLHSFIKKTQKTPDKELNIAKERLKEVKKNG